MSFCNLKFIIHLLVRVGHVSNHIAVFFEHVFGVPCVMLTTYTLSLRHSLERTF